MLSEKCVTSQRVLCPSYGFPRPGKFSCRLVPWSKLQPPCKIYETNIRKAKYCRILVRYETPSSIQPVRCTFELYGRAPYLPGPWPCIKSAALRGSAMWHLRSHLCRLVLLYCELTHHLPSPVVLKPRLQPSPIELIHSHPIQRLSPTTIHYTYYYQPNLLTHSQ